MIENFFTRCAIMDAPLHRLRMRVEQQTDKPEPSPKPKKHKHHKRPTK